MKINCNIADDLLPLYVDDSCSPDSKAAIEEHLKECQLCREKLARMRGDDLIHTIEEKSSELQLANYSKKIRRHRILVAILVTVLAVIAAIVLALGYLTVQDMHGQANPTVYEVEAGTHNLTAGDLETTVGEVNECVFFTNHAQIKVSIRPEGEFQGTVVLCNEENIELLYGKINEDTSDCTFTGLSSAYRYKIKCEGLNEATITVSEGREVSVWHSLRSVLGELLSLIN